MRSPSVRTIGMVVISGCVGMGLVSPARMVAGADTRAAAVAEPESVPVIQAAEAAKHVGQERCVEMAVKAARKLPDKEVCFLNSSKDHRAEDNFTAVMFKAGLRRFREDGIENPALHFIDATIRVRGVIEERNGKPQIVIQQPSQVTLIKAADPAERTR